MSEDVTPKMRTTQIRLIIPYAKFAYTVWGDSIAGALARTGEAFEPPQWEHLKDYQREAWITSFVAVMAMARKAGLFEDDLKPKTK